MEAQRSGCIAAIRKDLTWLWRSGYNIAIGGCSEWEGAEMQVATLFELAEKVDLIFLFSPDHFETM
jgi:hypothetical protein